METEEVSRFNAEAFEVGTFPGSFLATGKRNEATAMLSICYFTKENILWQQQKHQLNP